MSLCLMGIYTGQRENFGELQRYATFPSEPQFYSRSEFNSFGKINQTQGFWERFTYIVTGHHPCFFKPDQLDRIKEIQDHFYPIFIEQMRNRSWAIFSLKRESDFHFATMQKEIDERLDLLNVTNPLQRLLYRIAAYVCSFFIAGPAEKYKALRISEEVIRKHLREDFFSLGTCEVEGVQYDICAQGEPRWLNPSEFSGKLRIELREQGKPELANHPYINIKVVWKEGAQNRIHGDCEESARWDETIRHQVKGNPELEVQFCSMDTYKECSNRELDQTLLNIILDVFFDTQEAKGFMFTTDKHQLPVFFHFGIGVDRPRFRTEVEELELYRKDHDTLFPGSEWGDNEGSITLLVPREEISPDIGYKVLEAGKGKIPLFWRAMPDCLKVRV